MPQQQANIDWDGILQAAGPYPMAALHFVREGLSYTVRTSHEDADSLPLLDRHVSGKQLCLGLRDFAINEYGMLAGTVLNRWNIKRTDDFGRLVFAMIDAGIMSKTSEDTFEDFRGVYDFREAFSPTTLKTWIGRSSD